MALLPVGIKVEGDSRDAQRSFKRLEKDIEKTTKAMRDFARETASVGLGVLGAGSIEEGLSQVYDFLQESLEDYIEKNQEAAEYVEGTRQAVISMTDALFDAALGGDNLQRILGAVNFVTQELTAVILDNEGAIEQLVRDGFMQLLEVIRAAGTIMVTLMNTVDLARLTWGGFKLAVQVATLATLRLAAAIGEGILVLFRELIDASIAVVDNLRSFAQAVNVGGAFDGLIRQLDRASSGMNILGLQTDETIASINNSITALDGEIADSVQMQVNLTDQIFNSFDSRAAMLESFGNIIDGIGAAFEAGETAEHAYRRAVEGGNVATEDRIELMRELGAVLQGYATEWLGFHERFKQGIREKVEAEREYLDFIFDRYTQEQDKIGELAELRADAETAAQEKIQGAVDRTREAYDLWAASSVDAFELAIAGQLSYAEAARSAIGDVVAGLADEARARAIVAGATGNIAAAAALGAASVAIGAIAATLGASQGGGGGGGGSTGPTQINNVDVQVIGGPMGVTDDQIRQLSGAVQDGLDRGLIEVR